MANFFDQFPDDEAPTPAARSAQGSETASKPNFFDQFPDHEDAPEPESALGTFARRAAHGIPAAVAGLAGGVATGARIGAMTGNPWVALGGGLVGGLAAGMGADKLVHTAAHAFGIDDDAQLAADKEAHPEAAWWGDVGPGAAMMKPSTALNLGGRALSGGAMAGLEGVQEYMNDGTIDPKHIAEAGALGMATPDLNSLGKKVQGIGEGIAARFGRRPDASGLAAEVLDKVHPGVGQTTVDVNGQTAKKEASSSQQQTATGGTSLEQPPPDTESSTIGNGVGERSERDYSKGKAPAGSQGDMLTQGDMSPDIMAALQKDQAKSAPPPTQPIPPEQPGAVDQQNMKYAGEKLPIETGFQADKGENPAPLTTNKPPTPPAEAPFDRAAPRTEEGGVDKTPVAAPGSAQGGEQPEPEVPHAAIAKILANAKGKTHPNPSDAQIDADNYAKGHGRLFGRDISIENEEGSIRRSKADAPVKWESEVPYAYGDIKGTKGADRDPVDIALGKTGDKSFVIDQKDPDTGKFDEHKVFAGFKDARDAAEHYYKGFSDDRGPERLGSIKGVPEDEIKTWLDKGDLSKPFDPNFKEGIQGPVEAKTTPKVIETALKGLRERTDDPRFKTMADGIEAEKDTNRQMQLANKAISLLKTGKVTDTELTRPNRIRGEAEKVEGINVSARSKEDAAGKAKNLRVYNDAFVKAKPDSFDLPTAEERPALRAKLEQFLEDAKAADYIAKDSEKPYKPQTKTAPYAYEAAIKKLLLAKNPTDKSWLEFLGKAQALHEGGEEGVANVRAEHATEGGIARSRRTGDEAVGRAEAAMHTNHGDVEDRMIEAIDAKGKYIDVPHEEMEREVKDTPVKGAADIKASLPLEKGTKELDISKPEDRAKLETDTEKLARNLVETADRKEAVKPSEEIKAPKESVRKIDIGGVDKDYYTKLLAKAQAKTPAKGAIKDSELGKTDEPPKKGKKDLLGDFIDNDSASVNYQKIQQDVRVKALPVMRKFAAAFRKAFTPAITSATKTVGYRDNSRQVRAQTALEFINSDVASQMSEKADTLDRLQHMWIKDTTKDEQVTFMKVLEKSDAHDVPTFRAKLMADGISAKNATWMAEQGPIWRDLMDKFFKDEAAHGSNVKYRPNYVPHIWENEKAYNELRSELIKLGPTWMQKPREIDFIEEALRRGQKLKFANPIDVLNERWKASIRSNMLVDAAHQLQNERLMFPMKTAPARVKSGPRAWTQKYDLPDNQQWIISPDADHFWKNSVAATGLNEDKGPAGGIYRTWMAVKRVVVPVQLALGAFHEMHVIANIYPSQLFMHALHQSLDDGNWAKNFKTAATDLKDGFLYAMPLDKLPWGSAAFKQRFKDYAGRRMQDIWQTPDAQLSGSDLMWKNLFREGGASPFQSHEDLIGAQRGYAQAVADFKRSNTLGESAGAGARMVANGFQRAVEKMQEPMFKYQIPALKNAVLKREYADLINAHPELVNNTTLRRAALQEITRNVDDRFGEMFYKQLFWNKTLKDTSIATMLSTGWNLGQVRQLFGGVNQLRGEAYRKLFGVDNRIPLEKARNLGNDKLEFVAGYIGLSMFSAGALSYALSGQFPTGMDYFYSRNGNTNPNGTPQRVGNPFNTREPIMLKAHADERNSWIGGLGQLFYNKTMLQPIAEIVNNKDFYGRPLFDSNAPWYKEAVQLVDATLGRVVDPIAISGAKRASDQGGGVRGAALAIAGFGPAPKYIGESPNYRRINELFSKQGVAAEKPYEYGEKTGLGHGLVQDRIRGLFDDKTQSEARTEGRKKLQAGDREGADELRSTGHMSKTAVMKMANGGPDNEMQYKFSHLPAATQIVMGKKLTSEEYETLVLRNKEPGIKRETRNAIIDGRGKS